MSDDTIKRSDAIEAVSISCRTCLARDIEDCKKCSVPKLRELINAIPSADRPQGEWIERIGGISKELFYQCSKCYGEVDTDEFDYCPWCGAKMKGADNDTD